MKMIPGQVLVTSLPVRTLSGRSSSFGKPLKELFKLSASNSSMRISKRKRRDRFHGMLEEHEIEMAKDPANKMKVTKIEIAKYGFDTMVTNVYMNFKRTSDVDKTSLRLVGLG